MSESFTNDSDILYIPTNVFGYKSMGSKLSKAKYDCMLNYDNNKYNETIMKNFKLCDRGKYGK